MDGFTINPHHETQSPPIGYEELTSTSSQCRTLVDLVALRGRIQHDDRAISFLGNGETETGVLTFGQLADQTSMLATALSRSGATGGRVLLLYPSGLDFVAAFFGTLAAGATAVPAPHAQVSRASTARLQAIVSDAQPVVVLTTAPLLHATQEALHGSPGADGMLITTIERIVSQNAGAAELPEPDPAALALLQYTSGSTGAPRGVMISHAAMMQNLKLINALFHHNTATISVSWLPMFHDMGLIGSLLNPIHAGFHAVIMPPVAFLEDPVRWLRAITRYRGTTAGGPNFAFDFCVDRIPVEDRADLDLRSWDIAYSGSEPVRARTLDRFATAFMPYGLRRTAFYPCYGMAEATLLISGSDKTAPHACHIVDADGQAPRKVIGCGGTGPDHQILIVDPTDHTPMPTGEVGEIWFAGPSLGMGYWNRPEETAASFEASPADRDDPRWLRTGDLGFLANDALFVTGRIKDVIITKGRNHYPQDIEATVYASHVDLRRDSGAAFLIEEADTGADNDNRDRQAVILVAEVEARVLRDPPVAALAGAIRSAVSQEHGLHIAVVALLKPGTLPKTTSGKVQRSKCKALYLAGDLQILAEDRHGKAFWRSASPAKDGGAPAPPTPIQKTHS